MVLLTLDASSSTASVCVTRDDALLYESYLHNGRMHAAVLLPMVEDALRCAGLELRDVDGFACVVGPGSFTGVRIGVATVMGLAGDKPCAPVDALEALAAQGADFPGLVCPILDARAGQVYAAVFEGGARLTDDAPVKLEALLDDLRGRGKPCLFLGDGATANLARLAQEPFARVAPEPLRGLRASFAARLAAAQPETYVSADALRPLYLRAPQAERARNARLGLAGEEESHGG